ncbi:hypothetical protein BDR05DRAFT_805332 [Suillus weaverae]|nr:hypothetical protein BDR05DRAFT_805332 [Suillus weaverae]
MTASPQPYSGYTFPITTISSSTSLPGTSSKVPPKPKPVNVFSNDGSFLERFQRSKKEKEDKRKAEEALARGDSMTDLENGASVINLILLLQSPKESLQRKSRSTVYLYDTLSVIIHPLTKYCHGSINQQLIAPIPGINEPRDIFIMCAFTL